MSGGRIEREPVPLEVSLERRGAVVAAVPRRGKAVLTAPEVEEATADLRLGDPEVASERGRSQMTNERDASRNAGPGSAKRRDGHIAICLVWNTISHRWMP